MDNYFELPVDAIPELIERKVKTTEASYSVKLNKDQMQRLGVNTPFVMVNQLSELIYTGGKRIKYFDALYFNGEYLGGTLSATDEQVSLLFQDGCPLVSKYEGLNG